MRISQSHPLLSPVDTDILGREEMLQRPQAARLSLSQPSSPRSPQQAQYRYDQYRLRQSESSITPSATLDGNSPHPSSHAPYPHQSSFSSTGRSSRKADSVDLEKQSCKRPEIDDRSSRRSSAQYPGSKHGSQVIAAMCRVGRGSMSDVARSSQPTSPHHHTVRHISDDGGQEERIEPGGLANRAAELLIFFMLLLPPLSILLTLWTITLVPLVILTHPIRLLFLACRRRSGETGNYCVSKALLRALAPALNLHLRGIHSFPSASAELQFPQTLAVLLLATPASLALSLWAALLSVYWLFAAMIGDPDGLDGRSDGRELVLGTRTRWDNWLRLCVRPELRS